MLEVAALKGRLQGRGEKGLQKGAALVLVHDQPGQTREKRLTHSAECLQQAAVGLVRNFNDKLRVMLQWPVMISPCTKPL